MGRVPVPVRSASAVPLSSGFDDGAPELKKLLYQALKTQPFIMALESCLGSKSPGMLDDSKAKKLHDLAQDPVRCVVYLSTSDLRQAGGSLWLHLPQFIVAVDETLKGEPSSPSSPVRSASTTSMPSSPERPGGVVSPVQIGSPGCETPRERFGQMSGQMIEGLKGQFTDFLEAVRVLLNLSQYATLKLDWETYFPKALGLVGSEVRPVSLATNGMTF